MKRKEQIMSAALYFAKKNKNTPIPYLDFIEAAEWADRTMIENACEWLDKNITNYKSDMIGYIEYTQINDIIQDFRKAMEK